MAYFPMTPGLFGFADPSKPIVPAPTGIAPAPVPTSPYGGSGQARFDAISGLPGAQTLGMGMEGVPIVRLPYNLFDQSIPYNDFGGAQAWAEQRGWQLTPENAQSILGSFRHDMEGNRERRDNWGTAAGIAGLTLGGLGLAGMGPLGGPLGGIFGGAAPTAGVAGAAGGGMQGVLDGLYGTVAQNTLPNAAGGGFLDRLRGIFGGGSGGTGGGIFGGGGSDLLQLLGIGGAMSGGNALSDALGLTNRDQENAFRNAQLYPPSATAAGGAGARYNPETGGVESTLGDLDPLRQQMLTGAQGAFGRANDPNLGMDRLRLMREAAAPYESQALANMNTNLFLKGRLGSAPGEEDTATGLAYREFGKGLGLADLERQMAAQDFGMRERESLFNQGMTGMAGVRDIGLFPFDIYSQGLNTGVARSNAALGVGSGMTRMDTSNILDWLAAMRGTGVKA